MRFNDLLPTILANMGEGRGAAVTRWRQCIDLLAQNDISGADAAHVLDAEDRDAILSLIADMRTQVGVDQRIASIVELGSRLRSPGLVKLLSQDHPSLVSAMMARVRLTDEDWAAIIPDLGPLARSVLRRRNDLGPLARAALRQFGTIDLTLPASTPRGRREVEEAPVSDTTGEQSQIGRIVARIERFTEARAQRQDEPPAPQADVLTEQEPAEPSPVNDFTFETGIAGLIHIASGAPRSATVGLSIGMPALDSRHGADGMALGAFRRRAAFENARFTIGAGPLEGEWRISAEPQFERASGRFTGYVGTARREYPHESLVRAAPSEEQKGWAGLSAASMRQLIHELRTPLNAIQGYAEMIDVQLLGPVSAEYQGMARNILTDARSLMGTFDDLDIASRIERGDDRAAYEPIDLEHTLRTVIASFERPGAPRIEIVTGEELPKIGGDQAQIERMISHLVRAGCAALGDNERLTLRLSSDATGMTVNLAMQRPEALQHVSDRELLDHGYLVDQKLHDAPPLGLAFALKLVRGIAVRLGGTFDIGSDAFGLVLPTFAATGSEQEGRR